MKISVIIITHNRIGFLRESLASVHEQTLRPAEIIIVDDGSIIPVENTLARDTRNCTKPDIRFIRLGGEGPAAARNAGALAARGDILAFLDDDDFWDERYLETATGFLGDTGLECVITWVNKIRNGRIFPGKHMSPQIFEQDLFVRNHGIMGSNVLIRKNVFKKIDGYDPALYVSEDKDLLIRMVRSGVKLGVLDKPLVYYRMHDNQRLSKGLRVNALKISAKTRFLAKYADIMTTSTFRYLLGQLGYFYFLGGEGPATKLKGLVRMVRYNPRYLRHALKAVLRK